MFIATNIPDDLALLRAGSPRAIIGGLAHEDPGAPLALAMREALYGLCRAFAVVMQVRPLPPLYSGHVRYQREKNSGEGWEEWADPWSVAARGWGDCDDLILYRGAELLCSGEAAHVNCVWTPPRYHVRIRRGDGSEEDPSILLGG